MELGMHLFSIETQRLSQVIDDIVEKVMRFLPLNPFRGVCFRPKPVHLNMRFGCSSRAGYGQAPGGQGVAGRRAVHHRRHRQL